MSSERAASSASAQSAYQLTPVDFGLYALVVFAWSTSWIALKLQLGVVAPEVSLVWRFAIAAALMWVWLWRAGAAWRFGLKAHLRFALLGFLLFSSNFLAFYYGGKSVPSGLLAVVFSLTSVFNLVLASLIFRTPVDRTTLIGAVAGFGGIALMFWPEMSGASFDHDALVGLILCVVGTLSFCLGNMAATAAQRAGQGILSYSAWGMLYGTVMLAVFAALRGQAFIIDPTLPYIGSLLWLALTSSFLAFGAYLTLLSRIGAGRAGYATVMFPVVALAISTVFEGYHWTLMAGIGLVLVLAGNLFVLRRRR